MLNVGKLIHVLYLCYFRVAKSVPLPSNIYDFLCIQLIFEEDIFFVPFQTWSWKFKQFHKCVEYIYNIVSRYIDEHPNNSTKILELVLSKEWSVMNLWLQKLKYLVFPFLDDFIKKNIRSVYPRRFLRQFQSPFY